MKLIKILERAGCLNKGHTVFRNGYHGNGWIDKGFVMRNPKILDAIAKLQVDVVRKNFSKVEMLVGPIVDGAILASFIARHLGIEFAMTDKWEGVVSFHKSNVPNPPKRIVFIEDVIFTGESTIYNLQFLKSKGFDVLGASAWINRQNINFEHTSILTLEDKAPFDFYPSNICPLCKLEVPVIYSDVRE